MQYGPVAVLACAVLTTPLVSTLLGGCGVSATWTRRGPAAPSRSATCDIAVQSTRAPREYVVLGVFDLAAFSVRSLPKSDEELRAVIAKDACRVGADALVPGINGDGRYVLATVVKYVDGHNAADKRGAP